MQQPWLDFAVTDQTGWKHLGYAKFARGWMRAVSSNTIEPKRQLVYKVGTGKRKLPPTWYSARPVSSSSLLTFSCQMDTTRLTASLQGEERLDLRT